MDDLSCGPPGTVCCFDGCRKRCMDSSQFSSGGINREGEMYITTPIHVKCYRVLIRYLRGLITKNRPCLIVVPSFFVCLSLYLFVCLLVSYSFISLSSLFHLEKPRPGTCPSLSPPSEFCPSDFDECKFDWDCETSTKKCCSNRCYRVCAEPTEGNVLGKCMAFLNLSARP